MADQISFKTRIKDEAILYSQYYYSYYVMNDYLLISDAFVNSPYYIIRAEKNNYLHLLGVSTPLPATSFFDKCLNGTLEEDDLIISHHGQDSPASKGSIRRKIKTIPYIMNLFSHPCMVEEDFRKNSIRCSLASSNTKCTLGFISTPYARPQTLLKGNELDSSKAKPVKIVLQKSRINSKFNSLVWGNTDDLIHYYETIKNLICDELNSFIISHL
jgi:hypothetical protein